MTDNQDPPFLILIKNRLAASVAVAIKESMARPILFPKIIASGRVVAEQILELAFSKGIKVRRMPDLAEITCKLDLDTPIPSEPLSPLLKFWRGFMKLITMQLNRKSTKRQAYDAASSSRLSQRTCLDRQLT